MRWPWQRRAAEPTDDAAATAPAPERPRRPAGEWRDLPALQAVSLTDTTTDADPRRFVHTLATRWQVPPALEQLGHRQDVAAPSGTALVAPARLQVGYADAPVPVWPAVPGPATPGAPAELPPPRAPGRPAAASENPTPDRADEVPAAPEAVRPLVGRTSLLTLDPADLREVAPPAAAPAGPGEQLPPAATSSATALPAAPADDRPPVPRPPADAAAAPPRPTTSGVPDWFRSGTLAPAEPPTEPAAPLLPAARTTAQQAPAVATPAPEPVTPLPPARPRRVPWPQAPAADDEPSDQPADDEADHAEPGHDEPGHDESADAPADGAGHGPEHEPDPELDPAALDEPAAEPAQPLADQPPADQPLADQPLADLRHLAARDTSGPPHHPESSGIRRREGVPGAETRTIRGPRRDATQSPEVMGLEQPGSEQPGSELSGSELLRSRVRPPEPPAVEPSTSGPAAPPEGPAPAGMPVRRVLRVGAPLRAADQLRDGSPAAPDGPTGRTERPGAVQGLAAFVAAASAAVPDDLAPTSPGSYAPEPHAEARPDVVEATGPVTRADLADPVDRVDRVEDARPDVAAVLELLRPREDAPQVPEPPHDPTVPASASDVPWWATSDEHARAPRRSDLDLDDLDDDHDLDDGSEDASAAAVYDQVVRRLRHELLVERERAALLAD